MEKEKALYLVKSSGGTELNIWAASGNQAKRLFCREYGIRPSDPWSGLSNLSARKLKPDVVRAWEEKVEMDRDTLTFIEGMFEIGIKALEEQRKQEPASDDAEKEK